jgi:hypothetical protein
MSENNGSKPESAVGMTLRQVILVPVEFDVDVVEEEYCAHDHRVGWCLSDAVGGESDRHSHRGKIYRKAGEDENWTCFEEDVIFVYVPESELPKFDRVFYQDMEG